MAGEGSLQVVVDRVGSPNSAAAAAAPASSKPSLQVIVLVSRLISLVICLSSLVVSPSTTPHYKPDISTTSALILLALPTKPPPSTLCIPSLSLGDLLEAAQPFPALTAPFQVWGRLDRLLHALTQKGQGPSLFNPGPAVSVRSHSSMRNRLAGVGLRQRFVRTVRSCPSALDN